jgi:hypothetical protein
MLAASTLSPHNIIMADVHPFTVKIEVDPLNTVRFRWMVCEGDQIHIRSPHSYATRREATIEADKVMSKFAANWTGRK